MTEIFNFSTLRKTSYRSLNYKEIHKRQNDLKGQYSMVHFQENCKKVKIEVTGPYIIFSKLFPDKFTQLSFSGPVTSFFTFLNFAQKCARIYRPFRSFCIL